MAFTWSKVHLGIRKTPAGWYRAHCPRCMVGFTNLDKEAVTNEAMAHWKACSINLR
jgi:hypothetical protein